MSPVAPLSQAWGRWLAQIPLPSRCVFCGAWPTHPSGQPWCSPCREQWCRTTNRCRRCAARLSAPGQVCGHCLTSPPALASCCAAVDYGYPWSTIILQLKQEHGGPWSKPMAELMWHALQAHFGTQLPTVWAPIPLHPRKLNQRGHNQAWELTRALARCAVVHGAPSPRLSPHLLRRTREGEPQHLLPHTERWANVRGSFVVDEAPTPNASILLIDDVFTTGATLRAAAEILHQHGSASVHGAVFARTASPRDG